MLYLVISMKLDKSVGILSIKRGVSTSGHYLQGMDMYSLSIHMIRHFSLEFLCLLPLGKFVF